MLNKITNKIAKSIMKNTLLAKPSNIWYLYVDKEHTLKEGNAYTKLENGEGDISFKELDELANYLKNKIIKNETLIIKNKFSKATIKSLVRDILLIKDEQMQKNLGVMIFNSDSFNPHIYNEIVNVLNVIAAEESVKKVFFINLAIGLLERLDIEKWKKSYEEKKFLNILDFKEFKKLNWKNEDVDLLVNFFKKIDFDPEIKFYDEKLYEINIFIKESFHPENWFKFDTILDATLKENQLLDNEDKEVFNISVTEIDKILISAAGIKQKFPFVEKELVMFSSCLSKILALSKNELDVDKFNVNLSTDRSNINVIYEFNKELNKDDIKKNIKNVLLSLLDLLNEDFKNKSIKDIQYDKNFYNKYEKNIEKIILQNQIVNEINWNKGNSIQKSMKKNKI